LRLHEKRIKTLGVVQELKRDQPESNVLHRILSISQLLGVIYNHGRVQQALSQNTLPGRLRFTASFIKLREACTAVMMSVPPRGRIPSRKKFAKTLFKGVAGTRVLLVPRGDHLWTVLLKTIMAKESWKC